MLISPVSISDISLCGQGNKRHYVSADLNVPRIGTMLLNTTVKSNIHATVTTSKKILTMVLVDLEQTYAQ